MSLSAASLLAALVTVSQGLPTASQESLQWSALQSSMVTLISGSLTRGTAILIDRKGFFVVHRGAIQPGSLMARTSSGVLVRLQLRSQDMPTQLALLEALDALPHGMQPIAPVEGDLPPNTPLLALLPTGPIRAEFVRGDRFGVLSPSRRLIPLGEIRFESQARLVGGALLVTLDGRLAGTLNATLVQADPTATVDEAATTRVPPGNRTEVLRTPAVSNPQSVFGPSGLRVAYSPAPDVIRFVLKGFLSPDREAKHPAIGVICVDASKGGALIQIVNPGSTAQRAGLRPMDVIVEMGGRPVRSQVDFARAMSRQIVGETVEVRVRRGQAVLGFAVLVGRQAG